MTLRGRPLALSALALTLSTALFKLAYFVMKMRLGALGGAEALGAATGSLALVGLLFSLSHLGLPDRAMVQAAHAKGEVEGDVADLHALFLMTAGTASLVVLPVLILTSEDTSTALLLGAGALAQHVATVAWLCLRGWGKPWLESTAFTLAGVALITLSLRAREPSQVTQAFALSGVAFIAVFVTALARHPALRPTWPRTSLWLSELKKTLPYFVLGVTALWLGTLDIVVLRMLFGGEVTGQLECATLITRTGLQVPWLLGTLVLARWTHTPWSTRGRIARWVITASVLAILASLCAVLSEGVIAGLMGVPAAQFTHALTRAALFSPLQYIAVMGLPIGMSVALRGSIQAALLAFATALFFTLALGFSLGPSGVQLGHAMGYAVLVLVLIRAIDRA
jgi:hypothetical protein